MILCHVALGFFLDSKFPDLQTGPGPWAGPQPWLGTGLGRGPRPGSFVLGSVNFVFVCVLYVLEGTTPHHTTTPATNNITPHHGWINSSGGSIFGLLAHPAHKKNKWRIAPAAKYPLEAD